MLSNNIDSFQFPSCFIAMTNLDKKKVFLWEKTATKLTYNLNIQNCMKYTKKKKAWNDVMIKKWVFIYFSWEFYIFSFNSQIYFYIRLIFGSVFPWDKVWTLAIRLEHKKTIFLFY